MNAEYAENREEFTTFSLPDAHDSEPRVSSSLDGRTWALGVLGDLGDLGGFHFESITCRRLDYANARQA